MVISVKVKQQAEAECVTFVLTTFDVFCDLFSEQTYDDMESICFISYYIQDRAMVSYL